MAEPRQPRIDLPTAAAPAVAVAGALHQAGHAAYLVGGAVRDLLLGLQPGDFDVATDAEPDAVNHVFPGARRVGVSFGVLLVPSGDAWIEVATFRREGGYSDGRRPDSVAYTRSLAEDAARRDFTVNALYLDPRDGSVNDPRGGLADLQARLLRAVGDPQDRFAEDGLRLLRAVRLASACDLEIEPDTRRAMADCGARIEAVAAERIGDELARILTGPRPGAAFATLLETGLLARILPEVAALDGLEQSPEHHPEGDVWTHVRGLLEGLDRPTEALAWAALLHDVGKPATARSGERIRFPGHARVGAELSRKILTRLRRPRATAERVGRLVDEHMKFLDVRAMRESTRRRFLRQDGFEELLELHRLDRLAANRDLGAWEYCRGALERLDQADLSPPPLLEGRDLLQAGVEPGPRMGELLHDLETKQLDGEITTRQAALEWLRKRI
jgi:poly(A) polymerase